MNRNRLCILFIFLLLATTETLLAQEEVTARLNADRSELTVGDIVYLTLQIDHPAGYQLQLPPLDQAWDDGLWEVRSQAAPETTPQGNGRERTTQLIAVTLWSPGTFTTPPLPVTLTDPTGRQVEVTAEPATLTVNSVLIPGDTQLRDIKPQAALPLPPLWPWVLLALVVIGVAFYAWQRYGRRPRTKAPIPVVDTRPVYQIALDELDRVAALDLPARGQFKAHYTAVADILRRYLEGAFDVTAMDQTTAEIRQALKFLNIAPEQKAVLITLLSESDLVKFAQAIPDLEAARELPDQARHFVLMTKSASPSANGEQ